MKLHWSSLTFPREKKCMPVLYNSDLLNYYWARYLIPVSEIDNLSHFFSISIDTSDIKYIHAPLFNNAWFCLVHDQSPNKNCWIKIQNSCHFTTQFFLNQFRMISLAVSFEMPLCNNDGMTCGRNSRPQTSVQHMQIQP